MASYSRDPIQEMRMQGRMTATRPHRANSFAHGVEAMIEASREEEEGGLSDQFVDDWAETSLRLLSRLAGAVHCLEMRMGGGGGNLAAIAQQASLEQIRAAIEQEQMDHDELTVRTLGHMDHLADRLEALAAEASQCQARLFCECSLPEEEWKSWEFSAEDVLIRGQTIQRHLLGHMRQAAALNQALHARDPRMIERKAMWSAHGELAGTFQRFIPVAPASMREFTEKWVSMWSSEDFRESLNERLVARKDRAKEKVRSKKVNHVKKWWELFKRRVEPAGLGAPTHPLFRSPRSWAGARI